MQKSLLGKKTSPLLVTVLIVSVIISSMSKFFLSTNLCVFCPLWYCCLRSQGYHLLQAHFSTFSFCLAVVLHVQLSWMMACAKVQCLYVSLFCFVCFCIPKISLVSYPTVLMKLVCEISHWLKCCGGTFSLFHFSFVKFYYVAPNHNSNLKSLYTVRQRP